MVAAEADWLYNLEEWDAIFDADKKKGEYRYVCCAIDDIGCFFIFVVSVSYPEK